MLRLRTTTEVRISRSNVSARLARSIGLTTDRRRAAALALGVDDAFCTCCRPTVPQVRLRAMLVSVRSIAIPRLLWNTPRLNRASHARASGATPLHNALMNKHERHVVHRPDITRLQ